MAYAPGNWFNSQTNIPMDRVATSQAGPAYIGGMPAQLPTQDMSFMWGGNGGASAGSSGATGAAGMSEGESAIRAQGFTGTYDPGFAAMVGYSNGPNGWNGPGARGSGPGGSGVNMAAVGGIPSYMQEPGAGGGAGIAGMGAAAPGGWGSNFQYRADPASEYMHTNTPTTGAGIGGALSAMGGINTGAPTAGSGFVGTRVGPGMGASTNPQDVNGWLGMNGGGSSAGGMTPGITSTPYGPGGFSGAGMGNPNLSGQADDIQRRTESMLGNSFAGINSQAVGSGGLGGSRQAVAQGTAGGQAADFLQGNLAKLYGNAWESDQNRGLSRYQGDQQFQLGDQGQKYGFYAQNRGLDQSQFDLGLKAYNLANQSDWNGLQNAGGVYGGYANNGTTNTTSNQGGGWQGILGGAISGASMGRQMGWW